ncbi:MAG TPA: L-seryl-tRNA(Sec) selenium transferase, partial [Deltaproteobacteria bacterium]|nr:L-seryl-tRNA(Sec) selenium transferase [Deltaproteobacteria bacterium]
REFKIPVFVDMGSGTPFDLAPYGIPGEWTVPSCLAQGADVVCFSGDKVLGGPQAGIILGRSELVERMARHPLHRAVRVDKFTIASLGATFRLIAQGRMERIPVLRMITEPDTDVKRRAQRLMRLVKTRGLRIVPTRAVIGGGAAPTKTFASYGVAVRCDGADRIHARLRALRPAVLCRIEEDTLLFDLKAVDLQEVPLVARAIDEVMGHGA